MSGRKRFLVMLALMPVWLTPLLTVSIRDHGEAIRATWPQWHVAIEQFVLVVAAVSLVAAVAAGIVTWRREGRRHA